MSVTYRRLPWMALVLVIGLGWSQRASAAPHESPGADACQRSIEQGVAFLKTIQTPDGAYSPAAGTGVTAVVVSALLRIGRSPDDPLVAKSLKYLEGFVQPDGGVHGPESLYANYETCLAIACFSLANRDGRYAQVIRAAEKSIKKQQWDEDEGQQKSDYSYGGAGYGKHKRPDLSNTSFFIEALKAAGAGPDDPAMQKALLFVSRCQNLESEHNTSQFAAKNPDGGFYYTAAAGGSSMAGTTSEGGLRSYGSMTYAGLKSMLYAGVGPDDPRVKAAVRWIQKHYDLQSNPGMGDAGLYYYYHIFAKALDAMGQDEIQDASGARRDWRLDLRQALIGRQQPNGSWLNTNSRWLEGDPALVTGYALLTLSYCRPAK